MALVALAQVLGPASASAEEVREERPRRELRVEPIVDGALVAIWLALLPGALVDPTSNALVGPSFHGPEDVDDLAAAAESSVIGRPRVGEETITDAELGWALAGGLGAGVLLAGIAPLLDREDQDRRWWGEQALAATLGMLQTLIGTEMLTEVVKNGVGRLRPDFADRADRYYCYQEPVAATYRARCAGLRARDELGPPVDEAEVRAGRRSFWSGHAALSTAAMTYAALLVGGRMVWNRGATALTRTLGILCQGAALAAALFIGQSRITDGVHHPEDVWVGTAVGFAFAQASYWLHFDARGEVRRGFSLHAAATGDGVSGALAGTF